jgi:hypothetical protein
MHAKQTVYCLSHTSSPTFYVFDVKISEFDYVLNFTSEFYAFIYFHNQYSLISASKTIVFFGWC